MKGGKIRTALKIIAPFVGAGAIIVAALIPRDRAPTPPEPSASGRILSPRSGDSVPPAFTVTGRLAAIPADRHVWVAVQVGNYLFPKEPEILPADRGWSQQVVEGGDPPGGFSLVLLMVDAEGHGVIEEWLRRGREGGGLPGLDGIPGSVKLDVVSDLVLE